MIGLERFSLYQNEDELKADLEQTNLVNCLSWNFLIQRDRKGEDGKLTDKFMNEMLFYAVKEEEPWEGLNCFIYDYRPVFYSNALACALLTLKYLSAEEVPFKELMCDKQKGETTKNNHGIDADVQRLKEKLDSFLKYENEILMSEGKENGYIQTMYPCRYIPSINQESVKDFLAPVIRKIAKDMIEDEGGEEDEYIEINRTMALIKNQLNVYQINRKKNKKDEKHEVDSEYDIIDDENESTDQRQRKTRLKKLYKSFFNELLEIEKSDYAEASWSERVMNQFVKEMIYHCREVIELENYLSIIKFIPKGTSKERKRLIEEEINMRLFDFTEKRCVPIVFYSDKLIIRPGTLSNKNYICFLKKVTMILYMYAGMDAKSAYKRLSDYVNQKPYLVNKDDGERMNLFEFKPIEYIGDQEERKSFLISTMSHIMRAFYDREPYEPTGEPQSFWASVIDSTVLSTQ